MFHQPKTDSFISEKKEVSKTKKQFKIDYESKVLIKTDGILFCDK